MAIEIETSTDSVEEVQAALSKTAEVELAPETPAGEEVKDPPEEEQTEGEQEETPDSEEPAGEDDTEEEKPAATDKKEGEPKPAAKAKTVPMARLNEEIRKRKAVEAELRQKRESDRSTKPDDKPIEPERPKTFSGVAEPKIEDFLKDVDEFDQKAVAQATAKFSKAAIDWARQEGKAEDAYDRQQEERKSAENEKVKLFKQALPDTIARRPEYNDLVPNSNVFISDTMKDCMFESTIGPDLLLHFVLNPDQAERVCAITSLRGQVREMEKIEAELLPEIEAARAAAGGGKGEGAPATPAKNGKIIPPKKTAAAPASSNAPAPPARVRSAGTAPKTEQELAGTQDKTGVDIDFNPEYEKSVKNRRKI